LILVDTSVWVDHLRTGHSGLASRLNDNLVLGHPWVTGELALGHLTRRAEVIGLMSALRQATVATDGEVMVLVERYELYGLGIGYVDAQLLASTLLTGGAKLWTADRRLRAAANRIGCAGP
jgi:predicted nucleic acid-binding protein